MNWLQKLRLRVLAYVLGVVLAALGIISLTTIPAWPIVGVAVAAVAVVLNSATNRLGERVCLACGADLKGRPIGTYGPVCPDCGSVSPMPMGNDRTA